MKNERKEIERQIAELQCRLDEIDKRDRKAYDENEKAMFPIYGIIRDAMDETGWLKVTKGKKIKYYRLTSVSGIHQDPDSNTDAEIRFTYNREISIVQGETINDSPMYISEMGGNRCISVSTANEPDFGDREFSAVKNIMEITQIFEQYKKSIK